MEQLKQTFVLNQNLQIFTDDKYVQEIEFNKNKGLFFMIESDFGLQILNDQFQCIENMQFYHKKRINQIIYDDENNLLISCSNDGGVKIKDINSKQIIKEFKKNDEIYSISKSKHILCGGSENGKIYFWDLRKMKEREQFNESHSEDVTCVQFHNDYQTYLMSCSTDGMVCLFDLNQDSEENSIQSMLRMQQPLFKCNYIQNSLHNTYATSTTGQIYQMDLINSQLLNTYSPIENNEFNSKYLIGMNNVGDQFIIGDFNTSKQINSVTFNHIQQTTSNPQNLQYPQIFNIISKARVTSLYQINQQNIVLGTDDGYLQTYHLNYTNYDNNNKNINKFQKQFHLEEDLLFEDLQQYPLKNKQAINKSFQYRPY